LFLLSGLDGEWKQEELCPTKIGREWLKINLQDADIA
jgi:hypothetical protein